MFVIGIVLLIFAALFLIVGGMAATKKLPGNSIFGVRVTEARRSREAWDATHAVAGPVWMLGGVALVFGGITALSAHGWMWLIPVAAVLIAIATLSIGGILGARAAYLHAVASGDNSDGGCDCGDGGAGGCCSTDSDSRSVDLDALRNAARSADQR